MVEMKDEDGQHRDGTEAVDFRSIGEWLRRVGQSGSWGVEGGGAEDRGEVESRESREGRRLET